MVIVKIYKDNVAPNVKPFVFLNFEHWLMILYSFLELYVYKFIQI